MTRSVEARKAAKTERALRWAIQTEMENARRTHMPSQRSHFSKLARHYNRLLVRTLCGENVWELLPIGLRSAFQVKQTRNPSYWEPVKL